ncbi:sporulation related protein, partial [Rhodobacter sp. 140A]
MHLATAAGLAGLIWTGPGAAEPVWLQIEAQPSLPQAEERVRDWAGMFPDIAGFAMSTGWYAIAIGPFADTAEATARLRTLRREGLIPGDSYVSDGGRFRGQFWPNGTAPLPGVAGTPAPEDPAPETAPDT